MPALGWLLNLDFAGGSGEVPPVVTTRPPEKDLFSYGTFIHSSNDLKRLVRKNKIILVRKNLKEKSLRFVGSKFFRFKSDYKSKSKVLSASFYKTKSKQHESIREILERPIKQSTPLNLRFLLVSKKVKH